jgi:TonB family protein
VKSSPRRQPSYTTTVVVVTAISVAAHVLLVSLISVSTPSGDTDEATTAHDAAAAAWVPPESCVTDLLAGAAARALYCSSPLAADDCGQHLASDVRIGLDLCERKDEPVAVALMDDRWINRIEPAPLETLLAPEPVPPPPQPPPVIAKVEPVPQQQQPPPPPPPDQSAQIIETVKPENEQAPDRARFISEYDTRVEKETVARGAVDEEMVQRPGPKELESREKVTEEPAVKEPVLPDEVASEDTETEGPPSEGELAMRKPGPDERREAQESATAGDLRGVDAPGNQLGVQPRKGDGPENRRRIEAVDPGRDGVGRKGGKKKVPDLRPSEDLLARVVGGGSVDHLEGVEEGDETMLNSVGWKHAGFFNRLKRQVAQNWHPADIYARRDPQGNVYGHKNRRTVVRVSLQPDGRLADIIIVKKSGVDFLDEEAIRAFRAAQPFPNPPEALVDAKTKLITFTFGFHFEVDAGNPWQIIKYR